QYTSSATQLYSGKMRWVTPLLHFRNGRCRARAIGVFVYEDHSCSRVPLTAVHTPGRGGGVHRGTTSSLLRMELRHLRTFVTVAETLNISAAARRLRVTQPALSRQIRDLEFAVGHPLFVRHPGGLRL